MEVVAWLVLAAVAAAVGRFAGARSVRSRYQGALGWLDRDLQTGRVDPRGDEEELPELAALRRTIGDRWEPRSSRSGNDPSLGRIAGYLRQTVARPLLAGLDGRGNDLPDRVRQALDAVEDLEFFAATRRMDPSAHDLAAAVRAVAEDYAGEFERDVDVQLPPAPVPAHIDAEAFKDAVYLVLVNAGRFGGEGAIDVKLQTGGGIARLTVRDRGSGFSGEALERALDPFYTTDPGSLGLGLTHGRRVVEAHGGDILLRKREGGGGEVEIVLPLPDVPVDVV